MYVYTYSEGYRKTQSYCIQTNILQCTCILIVKAIVRLNLIAIRPTYFNVRVYL